MLPLRSRSGSLVEVPPLELPEPVVPDELLLPDEGGVPLAPGLGVSEPNAPRLSEGGGCCVADDDELLLDPPVLPLGLLELPVLPWPLRLPELLVLP